MNEIRVLTAREWVVLPEDVREEMARILNTAHPNFIEPPVLANPVLSMLVQETASE